MKKATDDNDTATKNGHGHLAAGAGVVQLLRAPTAPAPVPFAGALPAVNLPIVRIADVDEAGPVKWLVRDLWVAGAFGFVGAEPKAWKSWLTLLIAICVAAGRDLFGKYEVQQGRVILFSAEGGRGLVRRRVGQLCRALEIEIGDLDLSIIDVPVLRLDDPGTVAAIKKIVEEMRPALLVLDPLRELHTGDENDAAVIAGLLAPLREMQAEGTAIMLVHHMGKAPNDGKSTRRQGQRLRGSSALHGASDSALYLSCEGEGEQKRVTVAGEHRGAEEPEPFVMALRDRESPQGRLTWLELVEEDPTADEADRALAVQETMRRLVTRAIKQASMPGRDSLRSATAIALVLGKNKKNVLATVKAMLEEGAIVVGDDGFYRLPEGGEDDA